MSFALPWALWGLLALPALAAIYRLHRRSRRQPVSSLLFWPPEEARRDGGLKTDRLRLPPPFFLELGILLLVVVAAAGPRLETGGAAVPLVVVLDDSFSMRAGDVPGEDAASPRQRAAEALGQLLAEGGLGEEFSSVEFLLAGPQPRHLGRLEAGEDLGERLEPWRCAAPRADLGAAVALAQDLAGPRARLLVLTDAPPPGEESGSRVRWWAFGEPRANVAFVNAGRSAADVGGAARCLLEIANLSAESVRTSLELRWDGQAAAGPSELELGPGEVRRLTLSGPGAAGVLEARLTEATLGEDALMADNHLVLLPQRAVPVRYALDLRRDDLRQAVDTALTASGRAVLDLGAPQLVFTDSREPAPAEPGTWTVRLLAEDPAAAYLGPFVLDRGHPLTEGLSLDGVLWAAGEAADPEALEPGSQVVIAAGNMPLLVESGPPERRQLLLRLAPERSTLLRSPDWPVLIWNLLDWRAASVPGLRPVNLRLGETARLILPTPSPTRVRLSGPGGDPDGAPLDLPVADPRASFLEVAPLGPGVHEVEAGSLRERFAANALDLEESDLRRAASGRWGSWPVAQGAGGERPLAWLFLLAALAVLGLHLRFLRAGAEG